jgi:GT2 family glycosyltransferase
MNHIHISVPTRSSIKSETVIWLLAQGPAEKYNMSGQILTSDWPIDSQRNKQVKGLLDIPEATHIFFLDSDVVPPIDALATLLEHGKDIVAGVYPAVMEGHAIWSAFKQTKNSQFEPVLPEEQEGLQPVDGIGMGCCLVARKVFEKLLPPWFVTKMDKFGEMISTEDFSFCISAKKAGFKIYADFDVKCVHHKMMAFDKQLYSVGIPR